MMILKNKKLYIPLLIKITIMAEVIQSILLILRYDLHKFRICFDFSLLLDAKCRVIK